MGKKVYQEDTLKPEEDVETDDLESENDES